MDSSLPVPQQNKPKNIPTVFIIFGATGDLMGKKIVPALFHLYKKGKFPKLFKIIGFSRRQLSEEEFVKYVRALLTKHSKGKIGTEDIENFLKYFAYQQGDFDKIDSYKTLAQRMGIIDEGWKVCSNKLFYLAVPPQYYERISQHLSSSGLTVPCGPDEGWTRVIVEKPFGRNLKTAEDLDMLLSKLFKEEQIYRIDHYLAKEMLQNILTFRFSNNLFEDEWDNSFIDRINIRTWEDLSVEGRGPFYDGIGALRDVGQNHLLQMLALITMERPDSSDPESIRRRRAELLSTLEPLSEEEIAKTTFRGQYKGYKEVEGVKKDSKTETYFRVFARLDSPRWRGVPIMMEAGKKLTKRKEIEVLIKHITPCLCPPGKHFQNKITFSMEPKEGIVIEFWSKKPGLDRQYTKRKFNFVLRRVNERMQYVEEYEKLLSDVIAGSQVLFLSTPEIQASWKYIDPIIEAWEKDVVPLVAYKPGTKDVINKADSVLDRKDVLKKQVGIIGLGKMGANLARRLRNAGWEVVGYNRSPEDTKQLEQEGITGSYTLDEFVKKLNKPRVVISMLPAGDATYDVFFGRGELIKLLSKGDYVIDGANSYYKDTIENSKRFIKVGVNYIDMGISGGPGGALNGACLMIGGKKSVFNYLEPLFNTIALPGAVSHFEGIGAGHFVKMIHNGIEYGMMQAIGEGFEILKKASFKLNLTDVVSIYNRGSVIESRLTEWLEGGFKQYGNELATVSGEVPRGGEGDWTVKTAKEEKVEVKNIEDSVNARIESEKENTFQDKVLNAMRNQFGGHSIKGKK